MAVFHLLRGSNQSQSHHPAHLAANDELGTAGISFRRRPSDKGALLYGIRYGVSDE